MNSKREIDTSYDVFISYRRSDGSCRAKLLEKYLIDMGYSVFLDLELRKSGKLQDTIKKAIKNSKNFILLITPDVFDSRIHDEDDWVAEEIAIALGYKKRGKIEILPISMKDGITLPKQENLPERIKEIGTFHIFDLNLIDKDVECERRLKEFSSNFIIAAVPGNPTKIGSSDPDERKRLRIQIENSAKLDKAHIEYVLGLLEKDNKEISVLDVGCEEGYAGHLLFTSSSFHKVLGIDKDEKCIINANEEYAGCKKYAYEAINLEDEEFNAKMDNIMEKHGIIKKFQLIYASMVLHHLKNPLKALKNLHKRLDEGGYIIVKGSDDGTKIISRDGSESLEEHKEILNKIMRLTKTIPGVSDREFGRKIYGLLNRSGFKEIEIYSNMRETSRMTIEEKELLFFETFEWRKRDCTRINEDGLKVPIDGRLELNMKRLISQFEDAFTSDDFWYCDSDYVGIARKQTRAKR